MNDPFDRTIDYLRISVTDRCNLRCRYCMPEKGIESLSHTEILRYEEIERIVRAAAKLGVGSVRLTGGEPLVRPGIEDLISAISAIDGIEDIAMTTNGLLLEKFAPRLADAGLNRVNISLDTLNPERYAYVSRCGRIEEVFTGIEAALAAGLSPLKINAVIIRGFNDDEIIPLSEWALNNGLNLRFIEFMPVQDSSMHFDDGFLSSDEIRTVVRDAFPGLGESTILGSGPSTCGRVEGRPGSLGIIEAVSHEFCASCNRIRLTADGRLRPCLFSDDEVDIKSALRNDADDVSDVLLKAVSLKPSSHSGFGKVCRDGRLMHEIGG